MSSESIQRAPDEIPTDPAVGEAPFDADSLLVTPALQQRIDLIEHLIDFGRQIIVMTGPSGIGKTNMLQVVSNCDHDNWVRLHYRGGPTHNAKALAARLNLDLAADRPDSDEIDILRRRMIAMQRGGHLPVLFLDDADLLPMDALQFVVELAHTDDPEAELRVVMTATTGRSALVEDLQRLVPHHAPVHVVELPRFNEAQTRNLVQKLAAANGYPDSESFATEKAAPIHVDSEGIPERIQVLARQQLIASADAMASAPSPRKFRLRINLRLLAALGLMGAVVATGYWWAGRPTVAPVDGPHSLNVPQAPGAASSPSGENGAPVPAPAPAPALPPGQIALPLPPAAPPVPAPAPGVPAPDAPVHITPLPPPATMPAAPAPAAAASAITPQAHPPSRPTAAATPAGTETGAARKPPPAGGEASATTNTKEPAPGQKRTTPAAAAKTPKPKDSAVAASSPRGSDPAAAGTHVIQLFGLRDRAKAQRFIDSHGITGEAAIVTSSLHGSPLYLVVYGRYPTRKLAQQALAGLPADLKALKPWIRSAAGLRAASP